MATLTFGLTQKNNALYRWASALALIIIFYNILEGLVSVYFGLEDETIALCLLLICFKALLLTKYLN